MSEISLNTQIKDFKSILDPWDSYIENGRNIFGDEWIFKILAAIIGGIKSKESFDNYHNLTDDSLSLCKRTRYARLKSGSLRYWEEVFSSSEDLTFKLLVFFTWATPKTIIHLLQVVSSKLKTLNESEYLKLKKALVATSSNSNFTRSQDAILVDLLSNLDNDDEVKYLISIRFNQDRKMFVYDNIRTMTGKLETVKEDKFQYLLSKYLGDPNNLDVLAKIKDIYPYVDHLEGRHYYRHQRDSTKIPYEIAKIIMEDPMNYPQLISTAAEKSCRVYSNQNLIPVGEVAKNDRWFENYE